MRLLFKSLIGGLVALLISQVNLNAQDGLDHDSKLNFQEDVPCADCGVYGPDSVGGPDAFGYSFIDDQEPNGPVFQWIDHGSAVLIASGDDNSSSPIALGNAFNFYGIVHSSLVATTNGFITDNTSSHGDVSNDCPLPSNPSTGSGPRIYAYHDDLITDVYYEFFASSPVPHHSGLDMGVSVFTWIGGHFGAGDTLAFQALLYDNGDIVVQTGESSIEAGSGSTTGLQNGDASIGITYVCNTASSVLDSSAVRFNSPFALPGVCYATTGTMGDSLFPPGSFMTINTATGAGTLIGATGFAGVPGLAIDSDGNMFGTEVANPANLLRINASTGAATVVGNTGLFFPDALAFDGNNVLYGTASNGNLYTINTSTGAATLVGPMGGNRQGLAFDPTTGVLWGSGGSGDDNIYNINHLTGASTVIGATGLGGPTPDIHFDAAGNLYGSKGGGGSPNDLISIDKTTGAGSVIGPIGSLAVSGMAARLDRALQTAMAGVCYATTGTMGDSLFPAGSFITINTATGAGTLIGPTGFGGVPGLAIDSEGNMFGTEVANPANLLRLNAATGTATVVGNTGLFFPDALAFDGNDVLYGTASNGNLYTINTSTGAATLVGAMGGNRQGLAFDPTDGTLYGSGGSGDDNIYKIDHLTGASTVVGATGLGGPTPDIHFDDAGNLYGSKGGGGSPNDLISIDKATGAGSVIGPIGARAVSGMAARLNRAVNAAAPGVCYATTGTMGDSLFPPGSFMTINTATGAGTLIGATGFAGVPGLAIDSDGNMYGTEVANPANLLRLNANTGVANVVGSTGLFFPDALAFDGNNVLYGTASNGNLYTINTATGAATLVGPMGGNRQGLAFDPTDGTLWGSGGSGDDNIYIIDHTTGASTVVGATGLGGPTPDLHFDAAGNLYGSKGGGSNPNDLISIDKTTGVGTVIGPIGALAVSGLAARLDREVNAAASGVCYATTGTMGDSLFPPGSFMTINTTTGAGTLIGPTGFAGVPGLAIDTDGNIFGTEVANPANLLKLNAVTGVATVVGNTGLFFPDALAFDGNNVLYGTASNGNLYTINTLNGSATLVGPMGGNRQGLAFDPITGILWGSGGSGDDNIYNIDHATGASTVIGATGLGGPTPDIHFDAAGNLYGSKGGGGSPNDLISIDKTTGAGTVIGPIGALAVSGLAARLDREVIVVPGIGDDPNLPDRFALHQNYPNPFNPTTSIKYDIKTESKVTLKIYNVLGQEVRSLVSDVKPAGRYEITWNGKNNAGLQVSSGLYIYRIEAGKFIKAQKMMLLK